MQPTFGGVNPEDNRALECFATEESLHERPDIPVFHDNQHETAITPGAALVNATDIVDKELEELKVVFSGAGASATATARFYESLGVRREDIPMCDSSGNITEHRAQAGEVNEFKREFVQDVPEGDLADTMDGADVFAGLSVGGIVSRGMIRSMAGDPIFAMANPDPEIGYEEAKQAREDTVIVATGRPGCPN